MKAKIMIFATVLLLLSPLAFSQSKETGSIEGTVADQENVPLPGVTLTATSPNMMGSRTVISDAGGKYRFPALPPGVYQIKAEISGFRTFVQEDIRVQTTMRLTVDVTMIQSTLEAEVSVIAKSPTVDVKSTETASVTLSNEVLRNIPYNQFSANIVNLAPGVSNNVAYGASQNTGIAYSMDGVNVADPEGGSAWVFVDHNIIEEAKIMGLGLPAEYGNFTGVIFNLVTKSGGNEFSGHMEFDFQGKQTDKPKGFWQTDNNQEFINDFPLLTSPRLKLFDVSAHLGGPIKPDKVWFYTGVQYYRSMNYPTAFPEAIDYKQPRWFGKLTAQLSPSTPMTFSLEIDTYNGKNRNAGYNVFGDFYTPDATVTQKSPEAVGNFSLTHIFNPKTFVDFKGAFFWGYYDLEPVHGRGVNGHYNDGQYTTNSVWYYDADRSRFQLNATLTHYAEDFIKGSHDFKFGVEVERSWSRTQYGYNGTNNTYYYDNTTLDRDEYDTGPNGEYYAYQYAGYDTNTSYIRTEAFAQDSWQISSRLNINLGVRFSNNYGFVKGKSGSVFHTMRLAPRIGLAFDVFGDKSTVIKAHYGQFTEAMLTAMFDQLNPPSVFSEYISKRWRNALNAFEVFEVRPRPVYQLQDNIKHPYMEQFTVSIERELIKDMSFTICYINRQWKNFILRYDKARVWEASERHTTPPVEGLPEDITVYQRISPISVQDKWLTNDIPGRNPYRKYWGLEAVLTKRFSNKWQLVASYVYSKAYGTLNNNFGGDINWQGSLDDPNLWVDADGNSTNDNTHMAKIQATYVLPLDININLFFRAITGASWTAQYRSGWLDDGKRHTVFAEPRGSNHYPILTALDMRLEKTFLLGEKYKLGIIFDVFNVFNNDTITSWGTRYGSGPNWYSPSKYENTSINGHKVLTIQTPRQARVGIRLIF